MCVVHALPAGVWADFAPGNGDYQNYNVVRRFLDGQTVYADFTAYLGYGHLLFGSILTFIFGGGSPDLMSSKMAFQFAAVFSFVIYVYAVFRAIFYKNGRVFPLIVANIMLMLLLINPNIFINAISVAADFYYCMQGSLTTGNSARFLRGLAPVLAVVLIVFLYQVKNRISFINRSETLSLAFVYGIPTGIIFYYSNDYGISSSVSITVIVFLKIIFENSKLFTKLSKIYTFALAALISFVLFGTAISHGHLIRCLSAIFGTGGAQSWYYFGVKSFYLWDLDLSLWTCTQAVTLMMYLFILLRKQHSQENIVRYGLPLFFNMTAYAAENEYKLLSGGTSHEVSWTILYLTLFAEGLRLALAGFVNRNFSCVSYRFAKIAAVFVTLSGLAYSISAYVPISASFSPNRGPYVKNIGYFSNHGLANSILSTDEFLSGSDEVFATYATGLENYRDQFQPTGTDYIIHVLGNTARTNYIKKFRESNPQYVATLREANNAWEYWAKNANFFFYRELYRYYVPAYAHDYQTFWIKSGVNQIHYDSGKADLHVENIDDHTVRISIDAPDIKYGIADVDLRYQVKKKSGLRSFFMFNKMVCVNNESAYSLSASANDSAYCLSATGDGTSNSAIGITIVRGTGSVVLTSLPLQDTTFDYFEASLAGVYDNGYFSSVAVLNAEKVGSEHRITIANTPRNKLIADNADAVRINGAEYPAVFQVEGDNILISVGTLDQNSLKVLTGHLYTPIIQVAGVHSIPSHQNGN